MTGFGFEELMFPGTAKRRTINITRGCLNDCLACWACKDALKRGQIASVDEWKNMVLLEDKAAKGWRYYDGTNQFPTTHDIPSPIVRPDVFNACCNTITRLLSVGNKLVITTKPDYMAMTELINTTRRIYENRDKILFMFTVCTIDDNIRRIWAKNAPTVDSSIEAIKLVHNRGFNTAFICEPFLDEDPSMLFAGVLPFISTRTAWIGKMNYIDWIEENRPVPKEEIARVRKISEPSNLLAIYKKLREEFPDYNITFKKPWEELMKRE